MTIYRMLRLRLKLHAAVLDTYQPLWSRPSMRRLVLITRKVVPWAFCIAPLIICTTALAIGDTETNSEPLVRTWRDRSGALDDKARLVGFADDKVLLQKESGGEVKVSLDDLAKDDKDFAVAVYECERSFEQFNAIGTAIAEDRLIAAPQNAARDLALIDQEFKKSGFAAAFYTGTAFGVCGDPADLKRARVALDKAVRLLRAVCKSLPNHHERTFVSALNNRAIIAMREGDPKKAGSFFAEAVAAVDAVPDEVAHNVRLFLEAHSENQRVVSVSTKRRLESKVPMAGANQNYNLPPLLFYSLSHNEFSSVINRELEDGGRDDLQPVAAFRPNADNRDLASLGRRGLLPELTCLDCYGSGVLNCPQCGRSGTVNVQQEIVAFIDPVSGRPVTQKKNFKARCNNCFGQGGFECRSCTNGKLRLP